MNRQTLILLGLLFIALAVLATTYLALQRQEIRNRAQEAPPDNNCADYGYVYDGSTYGQCGGDAHYGNCTGVPDAYYAHSHWVQVWEFSCDDTSICEAGTYRFITADTNTYPPQCDNECSTVGETFGACTTSGGIGTLACVYHDSGNKKECTNITPTPILTHTPTPTRTPTPTITPTGSLTPTATVTPTPPGTGLSLSLNLEGFAGTSVPTRTTEPVTITLKSVSSGSTFGPFSTILTYSATTRRFDGIVPIGVSVPTGDYQLLVKPTSYLAKLFGTITLTQNTVTPLAFDSTKLLLSCDLNNDNKIDMLDIGQVYTDIRNQGTSRQESFADITREGFVDIFDHNYCVQNFSKPGEVLP